MEIKEIILDEIGDVCEDCYYSYSRERFEITIDVSDFIVYNNDCIYIDDHIIFNKTNYIKEKNNINDKPINVILKLGQCFFYDKERYSEDILLDYKDFLIKRMLE